MVTCCLTNSFVLCRSHLYNSLMASLFFDLARRRPQIEVEAKIYGGCALAFAVAMLPKALGAPADVSQKFYSTMADGRTSRTYRSSRCHSCPAKPLRSTGSVLRLACWPSSLCSIRSFNKCATFSTAADHGKNPKAARCLTIATACYATVQLDLPGKGTPWFFALISAASLTCSLCLLVVMYGRTDRVPYAGMARHQ